ncbi:MAG: Lcl C-terminal domain-containing protein [Eubacteriales bacterium]
MKNIIGWIGVGITLIFSGIWAYWGTVENFHEGWYSKSIWENLFMLVFQYLLFTILFVLLATVTLKWKLIGLLLHLILAVFCVWFFSGASFSVLGLMIVMPVAGLGMLYYFGEPEPKKWAYRLLICVPLIIITAFSIPQGIKVSGRINDNDFGTRVVEGNGVTLTWAPRGPGWPDNGTTWEEARRVCRCLSADGTTVMEEEQNIWRLPTVDEAVRSMMLHGENAGGVWHAQDNKAVYNKTPDKETPLWDVYSKVIYYWTSETDVRDERRAFIIVYHGGVFSKMKTDGQSYQSFRAVKETDSEKVE